MKTSRDQRNTNLRSIKTLQQDLVKFNTDGHGDTKVAKMYNNVIEEFIFDVPLNQVWLIY